MAKTPQSVWIKFCGTTNLDDALASLDAGADALGFIFTDSRRRVTPDEAAKIIALLPATIEKIGVFVNEEFKTVANIVEQCGLTGVQLQGDETPDYVMELRRQVGGLRVTKTLPAEKLDQADRFCASAHFALDNLLIDNGTYLQRGGTGQVFDWAAAAATLHRFKLPVAVVIAGGLNPENVGEAVLLFRPYGVDVCSGVESDQGHKNHAKLHAYVDAVRKAEAALASE